MLLAIDACGKLNLKNGSCRLFNIFKEWETGETKLLLFMNAEHAHRVIAVSADWEDLPNGELVELRTSMNRFLERTHFVASFPCTQDALMEIADIVGSTKVRFGTCD